MAHLHHPPDGPDRRADTIQLTIQTSTAPRPVTRRAMRHKSTLLRVSMGPIGLQTGSKLCYYK